MIDILYSPNHLLHDPALVKLESGSYQTNEVPARAEVILAALQAAGVGKISAPEDFGMQPFLEVHDRDMLEFLISSAQEGAIPYSGLPDTFAIREPRHFSSHPLGKLGRFCFGTDCPLLPGTWTAAYWSAMCALTGVTRLQAGERLVYALCRPPGHHAGVDFYGGFCYLNNAAIAARQLGRQVAILDIDYHHGNGTQEIFYSDPDVLFCSLHAHPDDDYPYFWGMPAEKGTGAGEGYNWNWTLPQMVDDTTYLIILDQALEVISRFDPPYLILSLGLDAGAGDPVGGFCLSPEGFMAIGEKIASLAKPTLAVQEGGYRLDRLGDNLLALLAGLDG